jgi:xanthine dehydrogenase accessory factor
MTPGAPVIVLRGGGDLATGVALRLHRCGLHLVVFEVARPLAVRRLVAAAEAVYAGSIAVEGMVARRAVDMAEAMAAIAAGEVPVLVDPDAASLSQWRPAAMIDGRMRKAPPETRLDAAPLIIGLGPGFTPGLNCHAVVETNRGHYMGRVLWDRPAEADTGRPEPTGGQAESRVLRAPAAGTIEGAVPLGSLVEAGALVARVGGRELRAPFRGALRGLVHDGVSVRAGDKIGDLDPRADVRYCFEVSDKALAVGGGVLEALLASRQTRSAILGE